MVQLELKPAIRQKLSVKEMIIEISKESQKPLIEAHFVALIKERYDRLVSGSNVNRRLRELQKEGIVRGLPVYDLITGKKKPYKTWESV